LAVLAFTMLGLVSAPTSFACSHEEGKHCYAVISWQMNRSKGEEVYGAHAALETYSSDVPNWELGEFIDDEMWVGLGGTGKGTKWVEGGTTTPGEFENAYTPDYFIAREYGYENYYEYDYKEASPGFNTVYGLYIDEPYGANGDWCAQWDWDSKPDFCFSGFQTYSTDLEAGMEYGTTSASGAYNSAKSVGQALWTNWTWHEVWAGSYNHAETVTPNKPLCISAPLSGHTWGSAAFSAPGC